VFTDRAVIGDSKVAFTLSALTHNNEQARDDSHDPQTVWSQHTTFQPSSRNLWQAGQWSLSGILLSSSELVSVSMKLQKSR
jgi:hypothetical protein